MHRASAYDRSQDTLLKFAKKFNSLKVHPNLYCCPIIAETMLNDGCFVDVSRGTVFAFDWEIRTRLESFAPGEFTFPTLTEFERKFAPEKKTQLFIQCDNREAHLAVAWRSDFMKSEVKKHSVTADYGKQYAERRETAYFKVFSMDRLEELKNMLSAALATSQYDHRAF